MSRKQEIERLRDELERSWTARVMTVAAAKEALGALREQRVWFREVERSTEVLRRKLVKRSRELGELRKQVRDLSCTTAVQARYIRALKALALVHFSEDEILRKLDETTLVAG